MHIKRLALTILSCFEGALMVGAMAAEPIDTNKPAFRTNAVPSLTDLKRKRAQDSVASTPKSSNQPPVLVRQTNTVGNISVEITEAPISESVLRAERYEQMNGRPIMQSGRRDPLRFLDRLPLRGGALFSKNPNARRNPLEVDGW